MATGKRKSSSGRKTSGRKTNSGRKKNDIQQESFTEEVILWVILAISILLFISNFGIGGAIGNAVSSFFFGVFGLIAYIFPVVLVIGTFFAASNKGNRIATVKIAAAVFFVLFLCMFIEIVRCGAEVAGAAGAYQYCSVHKIGGGFLGGLLAGIFCPNFGLLGSYVIDAVAMIICLVLITERSALKGVQKGSRKVYETAKESNERHRELVEQRREERELRRMDRKVEGVAVDTRVLPDRKAEPMGSDEVSEINIDKLLEQSNTNLPEIKAEKHVTLTAGGAEYQKLPAMEPETEPYVAPSAFSKEAFEAKELEEDASIFHSEPAYQESIHTEPAYEEHHPVEESIPYDAAEKPEEPHVRAEKVELHSSERTEKPKKNVKATEEDIQNDVSSIEEEIHLEAQKERKYVFPPVSLLKPPGNKQGDSKQHLQETAQKLQQTLKNFGVNVTITNISCGPSVTRYEIQPEMGVKVSKIVNLADDIKLNLAAADIRIEAPIPGKAAVGIEVPNKETLMVSFRELVDSPEFKNHPSNISFCVGKDIGGNVTVADIAKMPHLLIAGATGSGKSVCINTIIMSILYKADPKDVKLIMVDPKVVELSIYNGIPHLLIPVVTDPKKAAGALHWAVAEMTDRYQKFAEANVRDLKGYNAKIDDLPDGEDKPEKLPQIVIIVDELADLMMVAASDVEESICRLAQLARACGIHLIIATQRPSVNVITGLIKANMPSRIAFAVTSGIDSRTILDMNGAEKLLGKGDMLFDPQGVPKPLRVQGAFVSDKEVADVVAYIKEENGQVSYNSSVEEQMNSIESGNTTVSIDSGQTGDGRDPYFADAAKLLIDKEKGSIGMLQRYFKVGFNRAARIMDQLEEAGIVGPEEGTKPRKVLMSPEQFEQYEEEYL